MKNIDGIKEQIGVRSENVDKEVKQESIDEMDTIACGVDAMYDLLIGYSRMVTQRTTDIARKLGIADRDIERWAIRRRKLCPSGNSVIKSAPKMLRRTIPYRLMDRTRARRQ